MRAVSSLFSRLEPWIGVATSASGTSVAARARCAVADGGVTIPEAQPEDTALFLHTSGTTGKPKGVRPSRTTRSRAVSGDLGQSRAVSGNFGRSRVISGDLGRSRVISGDSSQGAALARKHIPAASWFSIALDRKSWRTAINARIASYQPPTNYVGRSIVMCCGSYIQGIVTTQTHHAHGTQALPHTQTQTRARARTQQLPSLLQPFFRLLQPGARMVNGHVGAVFVSDATI